MHDTTMKASIQYKICAGFNLNLQLASNGLHRFLIPLGGLLKHPVSWLITAVSLNFLFLQCYSLFIIFTSGHIIWWSCIQMWLAAEPNFSVSLWVGSLSAMFSDPYIQKSRSVTYIGVATLASNLIDTVLFFVSSWPARLVFVTWLLRWWP